MKMIAAKRRIRPLIPFLVGLVALASLLLPETTAQVGSVGVCRICRSYTQGGETYWSCPAQKQGAEVCTPSKSSCIESGTCSAVHAER